MILKNKLCGSAARLGRGFQTRPLFDESQKRTIELCFYHLQRKVQTNEFQEDTIIRAVLDHFMGLTQRKNKRLVSLDRLVSLEARTLLVCSYKLSFLTVLISHLGYPHNNP